MSKRALIFGIGGQDGAYLCRLLLEKGYDVHGTSRDATSNRFAGLNSLGIADKITLRSLDLADRHAVADAICALQPSEVYNLSAQSSVGLSFEQPVETLSSVSNATLNILEAIRNLGEGIRLYNASSSEMFGDTCGEPAMESSPFRPHSPYGVSKAAAHWFVENYRKGYGLYVCSGICFNHESPLRNERFVTQKIVRGAVSIKRGAKTRLKLGNLSIVRDWGWAPEYVEAMWKMLQQPAADDFVIATGKAWTLSDFASIAFAAVGLHWQDHVDHDPTLLRPYDLAYTVGNAAKAERQLDWRAKVVMPEIVTKLIEAELERQ
jgi:GDPmannose 4,6-dehydratase